ncbi:MAG: hypothetical protein ACK4NZ_11780 [Tsuneonella sp.]
MASRPPELRPTPPTQTERQRFALINGVRLTGVAMILIGILVLRGAIDLPAVVGYVFVPVGLFDVFFLPLILARKWRTPPQ